MEQPLQVALINESVMYRNFSSAIFYFWYLLTVYNTKDEDMLSGSDIYHQQMIQKQLCLHNFSVAAVGCEVIHFQAARTREQLLTNLDLTETFCGDYLSWVHFVVTFLNFSLNWYANQFGTEGKIALDFFSSQKIQLTVSCFYLRIQYR